MRYYILVVLAVFSLVTLSGCAPVISKKALEGADLDIKFADLVKDPARYAGKTVVLGGTIVNIRNLEDRTEIEVLQEPLGYRLKPCKPEESAGRFLVEFDGFKDPVIYAAGKRLTVVGTVKGIRMGELGKLTYNYPVIAPIEHYLWSREYEPSVGIGVGVGIIHAY